MATHYASIPDVDPTNPVWETTEVFENNLPHTRPKLKLPSLKLPTFTVPFTLKHAPNGMWKSIKVWGKWVVDTQGAQVCRTLAQGDQVAAARYKTAQEHHRNQVYWRLGITAVVILVCVFATFKVGIWAALALPVAAIVFSIVGKPPYVADFTPDTGTITPASISTAFNVALPAIAKATKEDPKALGVGSVTRDGPGYGSTIELPAGVTVEDCVKNKERVASGLRIPKEKLHLHTHTHAGSVSLWVSDQLPSETPTQPWKQNKNKTMWDPITIGHSMRGKPVSISLMYGSLVLGGVPQMGKTATLRLLQAEAILRGSEVFIFDLKGGGDSIALEPACMVFRAGDTQQDLDVLVETLGKLTEYMRAVYTTLRGLKQPKLTQELAQQLNAKPVFLSLDECQLAFRDPRVLPLVEDLVRRGPAAGIMVALSTQRPTADSIPTSVRDNVTARICLRVLTQPANDAVLGTGSYSQGFDATQLSPHDRGLGIVSAEGTQLTLTKFLFITPEQATLVGMENAKEHTEQDEDTNNVLTHIQSVFPPTADRLTLADTLTLLTSTYPDFYDGWEIKDVSSALRSYGLKPHPVKVLGTQTTKTGFYLKELKQALKDHGLGGWD